MVYGIYLGLKELAVGSRYLVYSYLDHLVSQYGSNWYSDIGSRSIPLKGTRVPRGLRFLLELI